MTSGVIAALAAGSLSFAKVHAQDIEKLKQTENALEKEIYRETRAPPKGKVGRIRHHGERFLHSKHVLLAIVILNVIDCILVMGELILDIHYIVDILEKSEKVSDSFINDMSTKYPSDIKGVDEIEELYTKILDSTIQWNDTQAYTSDQIVLSDFTQNGSTYSYRQKRDAVTERPSTSKTITIDRKKKKKRKHTIEEDIAHGFHKTSITILAILVIETLFKIFCFGAHMLDNKLEVFDCVIVFVSFTLDLVFIKGITIYSIQEFVFILAFLVPWRILRVVNSLIVAIIDHEHFRMKLLYMQKKQISTQMKEAKKEVKIYEKNLQDLEQLCISGGIPEYKIRNCRGELKNRKKKLVNSCASLQQTVTIEPADTTPMMTDFDQINGNILTFKSKARSLDNIDKT